MRRRELYCLEGPECFGEVELVALIVGTGTGGRSALQIAAGLLERFGGLRGLGTAPPQALMAESGIGLERAVRLHAALEAGRRSSTCDVPDLPVLSPHQAYALLEPGLRGRRNEELHALFLDRRRRPLARRCLTRGSDGYTVVDPRQVFREAIGLGAHGVVLAHNHPSGDPLPSSQDRRVTLRLAEAGAVVGVTLVDHLVLGAGQYRSLAEMGVLPSAPTGPSPTSWTHDAPR